MQVTIAGKPRTLLLDSGGGLTIVSSRVAAELGCQPHGRFTAHRMTNERIDMPVCNDVTLTLGGRDIRVPVAGVFDLAALAPKEFPVVDGVVSLQTFAHTPVTFDLPKRTLVLESAESLSQRIATAKPMEVRLSRPGAGVALDVFIAARHATGEEKVWFILDTGNDTALILAPHAVKALGANCSADGKSCGPLNLDIPGLGAQTLSPHVRELIYDGNIGVSALRNYALTFDVANGQVWATPR
ncbi:MAG: retropepsin-like domain-containing protein [Myxococcaceae bacterium]|nr:retropepsin-like domain-containing protein [Myxococcaceae bacterium]